MPAPAQNTRFVFLVGAHRSGTTLLRLMLEHHPAISAPGEFDFLTEIMTDRSSQPTGAEYLQSISSHRGFLSQSFDCDPTGTYASLVHSFVRQLWQRAPARVFVAVVHSGFHELPALWPEALYIHMLRDPRDVSASAVKLGWAGNVYTAVNRWITAESEWDKLRARIRSEAYYELKYEDLVTTPESKLRELCTFLGLEYSAEMLTYHRNTTYGPPDASLANQWRRNLSGAEIGLVEGVLGDRLQHRGYQPSGERVVHPSWSRRWRLHWHDRTSRFLFRLKRFGVVNTVGMAVARRLRLAGLERRIQLRVNEVAKQHLK
jgi:Sulfotransferase family